jgi:hypothetical protein
MSALSIAVNGQTSVIQVGTLSAAAQAQLASMQTTVNTIAQSTLLSWAYEGNFGRLVSATRDANDVLLAATIEWPDGTPGTYATDAQDPATGAINAWHATYAASSGTKTITQPAVTRNSNGAVIPPQPAITIT